MRIAQIAPPWLAVPPKGYGGIEWVVALLADGLAERGHDVTLFATGDSVTKAKLDAVFPETPGVKFINSAYHDAVQTMYALRDPGRFDVFHAHIPFSQLAVAPHIQQPVVHTVHGSFTPPMRQLFSLVADDVWFVAISEAQRSHMPELRYAGVVYNGIDVPMYPLREDKEDFVLFLGRTAPEKGALRAVEAARAAGIPLVMAVKIAHEIEQREWDEQIQPALGADVTVLGEVELEEKLDLLARAKAVLFPIDWDEPFGLVMTEAMACGTPVIATPRGSVPEVIADAETGFIVSVDDYPEEAAAALGRLGEIDPKACRRRVEERFSKEAMVDGYERAFELVVSSTS